MNSSDPKPFDNPYLEATADITSTGPGYREVENIAEGFRRRETLIEEYAWAIPNPEAIATICAHSPILEVGAGAGYWAKCISEAGGNVLATDVEPPTDRPRWHPVWTADARRVVTDYPHRALLLVWPSYAETWSTETLGRYGGDTVIYVGEGRGGCTGDDRFHQMLAEEWTLEATVDIPTYPGIHDRLEVYVDD